MSRIRHPKIARKGSDAHQPVGQEQELQVVLAIDAKRLNSMGQMILHYPAKVTETDRGRPS